MNIIIVSYPHIVGYVVTQTITLILKHCHSLLESTEHGQGKGSF